MRRCALLLLCLLVVDGVLFGQSSPPNRSQIAAAIERRLDARQPVELSADSIALTGKVLHLKGHARAVWLPDTVIQAEEITIDDGRVELVGNVNATLGSSSGVPLPPRIQYR